MDVDSGEYVHIVDSMDQVEESCIISLWENEKVRSVKRAQHEFSLRSVQVLRCVLKHCYYTMKAGCGSSSLRTQRRVEYTTGERKHGEALPTI